MNSSVHFGSIDVLSFSQSSKLLASIGRNDRMVRIWDVPTGEEKYKISVPDRTYKAAFSPDDTLLAVYSGGGNDSLLIFDIATGAEVLKLNRVRKVTTSEGGIAFSNDGALLAASTEDIIQVWEIKRQKEERKKAEKR